MARWVFAVVLLLGSIAAASAISEMNVVVFPDVPSTTFTYNFVFSSTSTCDVLLNATATITTNLAGRGNATIDTSGLGSTVPAYMCTYRDGILVNTQSLNRNAFDSFATSVAFSSTGNWTADKPSYALNTYVQSAGNWSADKPNYALNTYVQSAGNWTQDKPGYTLSSGLVTALGNWSFDKASYTASALLVGALGNWSNDKPNYALITYVNSAGNWTQDKPGYWTNVSNLQSGTFTNFTQIQTLVTNVSGIYTNVSNLQSGTFTNFTQIQTIVANVTGIYTNVSNLQNSNASAFVAINALNNSVISIGNYSKDAAGLFTNITNLQAFQTSTYTSIFTGNLSANDSMFIDNIIQLNGTSNPTTLPPQGSLDVYAKNISGRMMLKAVGPSGIDYPYQPSFFQNLIMFIGTGGAAVINVVGTTVTSVGTVTNVASTTLGYMVNQVTVAAANNTAGTGSAVAMVSRVAGTTSAADGWFFNGRVAYPDAASLTNMRAFVGLTSGTMAASVSADNPAGQGIGFMYSTTGLGANWTFMSDDNVLLQRQTTSVNFSVNAVYDMYMYCSHGCTTVYWRIDDLTYNQTSSGSISADLPTSGTLMRFGHQIDNVDATARNVRMQRIYLEMDR